MRKDLAAGLLALVMASGAVACGDDPTDPAESTLTSEEAEALAGALGEVGMLVFSRVQAQGANAVAPAGIHSLGDGFAPQSHGGQHVTLTRTVENVPCPIGGTVDAQVTLNMTEYPDEERVVLEMEGTQTHDGCRVMGRHEEFTITGDPNLSWSLHAETVEDEPVGEISLDYSGAFRWSSSDDREGRCTVDYEVRINIAEQRATMEGSFCGVTVEQTVTWTNT